MLLMGYKSGKTTGNSYTNSSVSSDDAMTKVDHPDTQLTDKTANVLKVMLRAQRSTAVT